MADSDYDLFIILGQSNAQGYVESSSSNLVDLSASFSAGDVLDWRGSGTGWVDVVTTPNQTTGAGLIGGGQSAYIGDNANGGFQNPFVDAWLTEHTGKKALAIQYARGGSGIVSGISYGGGNWTDTHLANAISEIDTAIAALSLGGATWKLRGVLWCQGEADASAIDAATITQGQYETALDALIDSLYAEYGPAGDNIYDDRTGNSKFFNIIRTGSTETLEAIRVLPLPEGNLGEQAIRDAQDAVAAAHAQAQIVAYDALFFGPEDLCWDDNVHWSQAAHNTIGGQAVGVMVDGAATTYPAGTAPSSLAASEVERLNYKLTWTAGAATAFQQRIEQKLTTDSDYTLVAAVSATATSQYVGSGDPGSSYHVRVGSERIDGSGVDYSAPITVNIPADSVSDSDISAYTTACSDCGATEETHIKQRLAALTTAGIGLGDGLKKLIVFRTDYQNNTVTAGATLFDVLRNGDFTAVGTITGGDGFAFASNSYYGGDSENLMPHTGQPSVLVIYTLGASPANVNSFFTVNTTTGKRHRLRINATTGTANFYQDTDYPKHQNYTLTSSGAVTGTNKSLIAIQDDSVFSPQLYEDGGASSIISVNSNRRRYQSRDRATTTQIGSGGAINTSFTGEFKVLAVWDRPLTSDERSDAHTILLDLATGTAASTGMTPAVRHSAEPLGLETSLSL